MNIENVKIAVLGLGYVGLPLAVLLSSKFPVTGFDPIKNRVKELSDGIDRTLEVTEQDLKACNAKFSSDSQDIESCNFYIVAVPTPIDDAKNPDLRILLSASETVGSVLSQGDVVVYESTVYPGATEEDCVPVLESKSGLKFNRDFYVGYSPERVNPGDRNNTIDKIIKVTSGSTPEAADFVDQIYRAVVKAGTHKAASIRIAEAAKVIENTQRDVNIALVNELSVLFSKLGVDTSKVLEAAGTKWNFLPFKPGLVGGHCIGVDPYYLTHKAEKVGHHPEIITAGRRINDGMGRFVAASLVKEMLKRKLDVTAARVAVLGMTFKENCPDIRNSRSIDVVRELQSYGIKVDVDDPCADKHEIEQEYGINFPDRLEPGAYSGVVVAVGHEHYKQMGTEGIRALLTSEGVLFDVKSILPHNSADLRL